MTAPATIGELRAAGWVSRTVKEEIRRQRRGRLAAGQPLIDGIVGYDDTVFCRSWPTPSSPATT